MKILAIEQEAPDATVGQFQPYLEEEAAQVWKLYHSGVIRELYFRGDQNTAVLILECKSTAEADALLATLPLVKAGLIKFELIQLAPYPGFLRLFAAEGPAASG